MHGATQSIDEPPASGEPPWKTSENYGEPTVHKPMRYQYIPSRTTRTHTKKKVLQVRVGYQKKIKKVSKKNLKKTKKIKKIKKNLNHQIMACVGET